MNIIRTSIEGVVIVEPRLFRDARGYFFESFSQREFEEKVRKINFVQDNESMSSYGVMRGLHFQRSPFTQSKLVRCVKGCVLDVAVDIRKGSPTYGKHVAVELSEDNHRQFFVSRGFAHGFAVLSEIAVFQYKCDNFYAPQADGGIRIKDESLGIDWRIPMDKALLSEKDIKHPWFDRFKDWYGNVLGTCLRFKPVVFIAAVVLLVGSGALCMSRGMTFMDMDMESNQISLTIEAKDDEKLDFKQLTELSDKVMDKISDIKGIDTIGATAGGSSTMNLMSSGSDSVSMYILLDEKSDVSSDKVIDEIEKRTKNLDCKVTASSQAMDSSEFFGSGLSVRIKGNDIDKLQKLAGDVADILKDTNGVTDIDDGLGDTTNELKITVDKEKAAKYGYTVAQVYQLVSGEISSQKSATTITTDIKDYEVYLQSAEQSDVTVDDIKNLTFTYKDNDGSEKEIPLSDICTISQEQTLSTIHRDAQTRYITVSGAVDENHNVTLLSNKIKSKIDKLSIPDGYSIDMEGEDETINESMSQLGLMLVLAVIFIYLIMVAQFQSLLSPFIIMFCIPLAFTGGFIALFITGNELGIISMLGFIMLAGLIVNNGIVLIDYINQARREGMSKHEAIIDAGRTRLRPILMTAMTTILAMFTSAIGIGDGSDMIKPMAIAIIGGLVYGTILTLIVIPCIYDAFNREKSMVEEEL